jgi:hypothetical protein
MKHKQMKNMYLKIVDSGVLEVMVISASFKDPTPSVDPLPLAPVFISKQEPSPSGQRSSFMTFSKSKQMKA